MGYPVATVWPVQPTTADSVVVDVVYGQSPTSCVPTYDSTFGMIRRVPERIYCDLAPSDWGFLVERVITLDHNATPPPRGVPCDDTLVEYGSTYRLGQLPVGSYTVLIGTDTVSSFEVRHQALGYMLGGMVGIAARDVLNLAGVRVQLDLLSPGDSTWQIVDTSIVNDSTRTYDFGGLSAGRYRLTFSHAGYLERVLEVDLSSDTVVSVLLLPPDSSFTLIGSVTQGCLGDPPVALEGCLVEMWVGADTTGPPDSTYTDSSGEYTFAGIARNHYPHILDCRFSKPGYLTGRRQVRVCYQSVYWNNCRLLPESHLASDHSILLDSVLHSFAPSSFWVSGSARPISYLLMNLSDSERRLAIWYACSLSFNFPSPTLRTSGFEVSAVDSAGNSMSWHDDTSITTRLCDSNASEIVLGPGDTLMLVRWIAIEADSTTDFSLSAWLPIVGDTVVLRGSNAHVLVRADAVLPHAERGVTGRPVVTHASAFLRVSLPREALCTIEVYSLAGRLLGVPLCPTRLSRGDHRVSLHVPGSGLSPVVVRARMGPTEWVQFVPLRQ